MAEGRFMKYKVEKWTDVIDSNGEHELWAVILDDEPIAFGSLVNMQAYADLLNGGL